MRPHEILWRSGIKESAQYLSGLFQQSPGGRRVSFISRMPVLVD